MNKPMCTVMVGLPGTGKSTIVDSLPKDEYTFTYSTDIYIDRWARLRGTTYDEVFDELIDAATKYMNDHLDGAIRQRRDVIWDQTNIGKRKRRKIVNRMQTSGYTVKCICIIPPEAGHFSDLKDWKHRLANRTGKTIPEGVLSNMYRNFAIPSQDEGFDEVVYYNMHGVRIDYEER